jgi:ferrous iron transport protein A
MRTILSYDTPMDMISSGPDALSLADLAVDAEARVTALVSAHGAPLGRLADLGFVPGEYVRVVARGALGGEPLAVRVGRSTFALRRHEAACVQVQPGRR